MAAEYRVLGPIEVAVDGRRVSLGGPRQRAVLASLLMEAGQVVTADRLIDEVWPEGRPETAASIVQSYVSRLRKELGRDTLETHAPGYLLRVSADAFDLRRFERLTSDGVAMLSRGEPDQAARLLREGLALWRGPALADLVAEGMLRLAADRLEELRLTARERAIEAELESGRHADLVAELEALVTEQPLREGPRALQMLALYRSGRQADALNVYRAARAMLVDELGIEPSDELKELERRILAHDATLSARPRDAAPADRRRRIVACALEAARLDALVALAEPLVREARAELLLLTTVGSAAELARAVALVQERRAALRARGVEARAAAFTSLTPGADIARLAAEQEADLLLVDAPHGLLEDARLVALLSDALCDVAVVLVDGPGDGAVFVPFTGAAHDWAAVELGAWLARSRRERLRLAGASTSLGGRDASRLLANASLAVQAALGVDADPVLVDPAPSALVDAAAGAGTVVVGLPDGWRHDGLGRTRTALATAGARRTMLIRRGLRPGGLSPREAETRFSWTIAQR